MHARANPTASLLPLLLAGLLAGMTYWLDLATRPTTIANDGKTRHDPDFIAENFEVRRFNPEGTLQHTLRASSLQHFPDDDSTIVLSPQLTYHHRPSTLVSAREARLDSKGAHVQLIDDVRVTRSGEGGKPDTVLSTQQLDAFPDDEIALSSVPVTITQGRTQIQGNRLNANNKTAIYVLDGAVHGVFLRNGGGSVGANIMPKPQSKNKPKSKPSPKLQSKFKLKR
jgi:lipopolysaccharide export system protein LptC